MDYKNGVMSLRKRAVSSIKWTSINTIATTGLQLTKLTVLTHLLAPKDFGLMAMVTVVIGFAQTYTDMGMNIAIIQRQDVTKKQLSSLYWLNILTGIIVFSLVLAIRPLVVVFYNEPQLGSIIAWAALLFVVSPFGQQFQVLLQKELRFDQLAVVEVLSTLIETTTAIFLAFSVLGVWSLVYGQLAGTLSKALMLISIGLREWQPQLHFSLKDLKGYLSFGIYQMGERTTNYFSTNIDYLLIGRFLGAEILGIYSVAFRLIILPVSKINPILTRVALPIFAMRQNDDAVLRRGYLELSKMLAVTMFPLLMGLAVTAPVAVPAIYGEKWKGAVLLTQILVPVGLLRAIANPSASVLLAEGRADISFKWNAFVAITNLSVFWFMVRYGVYGIAWSFTCLSLIYFVLGRMIMQYVVGLQWREYIAALARPAISAIIMSASVYLGYLILVSRVTANGLILALLASMGTVVYVATLFTLDRQLLRYLWKTLANRKAEAV